MKQKLTQIEKEDVMQIAADPAMNALKKAAAKVGMREFYLAAKLMHGRPYGILFFKGTDHWIRLQDDLINTLDAHYKHVRNFSKPDTKRRINKASRKAIDIAVNELFISMLIQESKGIAQTVEKDGAIYSLVFIKDGGKLSKSERKKQNLSPSSKSRN